MQSMKNRMWSQIARELDLPRSMTSGAFTLKLKQVFDFYFYLQYKKSNLHQFPFQFLFTNEFELKAQYRWKTYQRLLSSWYQSYKLTVMLLQTIGVHSILFYTTLTFKCISSKTTYILIYDITLFWHCHAHSKDIKTV